jgi:hypothetical protein
LTPRLHSIVVQKGAESTTVPVANFLSLPLNERLALILEQRITFYDEGQKVVPLKDALRILQDIARDGSTPPPAAAPVSDAPVLTLKEFLALPVSQRVTMVFAARVQIVDENGTEIPLKEALQRGRS